MKNKRYYKNIVLTEDFYGLIYSFKESLKRNTAVIYLNRDKDSDYYLSELNVKTLSYFLDRHNIKLSNYIKPINTMVKLDSKLIFLSETPYQNLFELFRKFGINSDSLEDIDSKRFNDSFDQLLVEISNFEVNGEDLKEQIYAIVRRNYYVFNALELIISIVEQDNSDGYMATYFLQSLNSTSFSSELNEPELIYYLVSAISRSYKVDSRRLINELSFCLKSFDRDFYITENVEFFENKVLLDGAAGLLSFNKMSSFFIDKDMKIDKLNFDIYNSLRFTNTMKIKEYSNYMNTRLINIKSRSLGGDFPHNEVFIDESFKLHALFYYKRLDADKESFYIDLAIETSFQLLKDLFIDIDEDSYSKSVVDSFESKNLYKSQSKSIKSSSYRYISDLSNNQLKKYRYLGDGSYHYMGQSLFNKSLF